MEVIKPDNKDFRIAELHVEGLSNPQIADALGINSLLFIEDCKPHNAKLL